MSSLTRSIPLFEPLLDRIGDYNPQLMRELRGQLKLSSVLATVGGAISFHLFLAFLYRTFAESETSGILGVLLGFFRFLSLITIVIACHQLIDNLASEVKQGTINPLRLSPQSSGQILAGKLLGVPVLVYLFNLLCLPLHGAVGIAAGMPLLTIAATIVGDSAQMICWLVTSLYVALNWGKNKSASTLIGTLFVCLGLLIQNTHSLSSMPWVMGFALTGIWGNLFWQWANHHFRRQQSSPLSVKSQQKPTQLLPQSNLSIVGASVATPWRSIRFFEPLLDQIGDINPQLMRELRGRLTARSVPWILGLSIVSQIFLVAYNNIGWLPGLLQWTIVIGSYQLIRNWSIEEDQGTFNPIRLSPQSARQIIWGKLLGVPSPIYLVALSCFPLYLIDSLGQGQSIGAIIITLAIGLIETGFWFSASLLFASLAAKTPGAKAILGSMVVGLCLSFQNLITANASASNWPSPELWFFCSALVPLAGSYLCGQAIVRRFHRPSATLWSKGQTYAVTAIATLCMLPFGLEAIPLFPYLILVQSLLLIQPRQVLFDWARRPAVQLPSAPNLVQNLPTAQRSDLIWGESSPPFVAIGVHFGIVAIGIGVYCLWNIGSIGTVLSQNALSLSASLLLANLVTLSVGLAQMLQLYLRRQIAANTLLFAIACLGLPLVGLVLINSNSPLWLMTLYPWDALAVHSPGYPIAALCLQWTGIAVVYKQFDRNLSRLARSDFARALEPTPTRPQEP
jgi:hypothetical protein